MTASITFPPDRAFTFDPTAPLDISLPLAPGADQVNCFWADPVAIDTIRVGVFVGSVSLGGSTNYKRVSLTPHGNGTHTECYGHIAPESPEATLPACLHQYLWPARVVTLPLVQLANGDFVVRYADFVAALAGQWVPEAIVLRTTPNDGDKRTRQYSGANPPYPEPGIGQWLTEHGVRHWLLDMPSVDRELDEGKLLNHHQFWQYPSAIRRDCTITELVYVPNEVPDGLYLLNLQVTSLASDASPSKPILYALKEM